MARIIVRNIGEVTEQIKKVATKKMGRIFDSSQSKSLLQEQAEVLKDFFAKSPEFAAIKTSLVGEFGFTPAEIANLDRILTLLVPDNDITKTSTETIGSAKLLILEWVDFNRLKEHPFSQHVLTKLDSTGRVIGITDIVSWIEWLEDGVTIRGFQFFKPNFTNIARSRSGEGLMREIPGSLFKIEPSRIFQKIEKNIKKLSILKKGFGLVVKKLGK
jgi:hypothetical protein